MGYAITGANPVLMTVMYLAFIAKTIQMGGL